MIQEEFFCLQKFVFPIVDYQGSVVNHLSNEFYKDYISELNKIKSIKADMQNISDFCNSIVQSLKLFDEGKMLKSCNQFYTAMEIVKPSLLYSYLDDMTSIHGQCDCYNRICKRRNPSDHYSALEMLHIPFSMRHLVPSYRFSIAGTPCTYMSLRNSLSWYECDKPEKFFIADYRIRESEKGKHKLLRLDFRPHEYFRLDGYNRKVEADVQEFLRTVCYIIPLIAACSFACKDKTFAFKEEYIVPQMLMSWIKENRETNSCIGVRYNSNTIINKTKSCGGHNIAIPIIEPDENGYCKILQNIFDLQKAKITFYDTNFPVDLPWWIKEF